MIKWFKKHIDALAFGAFFAIVPLFGDVVWWHRDYMLGEWTWHLGVILASFSTSIIGSIIAFIWYHKTKHQLKEEMLNRLLQLQSHVYDLNPHNEKLVDNIIETLEEKRKLK